MLKELTSLKPFKNVVERLWKKIVGSDLKKSFIIVKWVYEYDTILNLLIFKLKWKTLLETNLIKNMKLV